MYNAGKVRFFQLHRPCQTGLVRACNWWGALLRESLYRLKRKPDMVAMFQQVRRWNSADPPLPLDAREP